MSNEHDMIAEIQQLRDDVSELKEQIANDKRHAKSMCKAIFFAIDTIRDVIITHIGEVPVKDNVNSI